MTEKRNKKKYKKKTLLLVLTLLSAITATVGTGYLILYQLQIREQEKQFESLLQSSIEVQTPQPNASGRNTNGINTGKIPEASGSGKQSDLSGYNVPERNLDFAALRGENNDIYAWITIPDTNIDYPVLQHPKELDYYLKHNMDGSTGYPGCIYSQFMNAKDFSDFNTVLYGHNMKKGTMFANLHYYEDPEFFDAHPYIYIYTEDGVLVYQIFAAYTFSNVHLLMGFDLSQEEVREIYLENIFSLDGINDNFNRELKVSADSKILTLSTCIKNQAQQRYLVAAVLMADGRK